MAVVIRGIVVVLSVPGIVVAVAVAVSVLVSVPFSTPPLLPFSLLLPPNPLVHSHPHPTPLPRLSVSRLRLPHPIPLPHLLFHHHRIRPRKLPPLPRHARRNGKSQGRAQRILLRLFDAGDFLGPGTRGVLSGLGVVAFGVPREVFVFLPAADG